MVGQCSPRGKKLLSFYPKITKVKGTGREGRRHVVELLLASGFKPQYFQIIRINLLGVVAHAYNPSTSEAESGGS
jgi:hypothetical protein